MLKKILTDIVALIAVLFIIAWVYNKWFWEKDLLTHADMISNIRAVPDSADILYVGESSNLTTHETDSDKRWISHMIGDYFPTLVCAEITKPASHGDIYKVFLENIPKQSNISTVIVTLNLRSFNAQWIYSDLETPLQKEMVLLRQNLPIVNRFLLSFKDYPIRSEKENQALIFKKWRADTFHLPFPFPYTNVKSWDSAMAWTGIKDKEGKYDQKATELACHYIKAYGFQIDTLTNPRIQSFNDIIALAKERHWHVVFNLMAENVEKAQNLVGDTLVYMMQQNAQLLKAYYGRKGVLVVDNLDDVADHQFIDQEWTTEHYKEIGRQTIAKKVALALRKWYAKDFVPYQYPTTTTTNTQVDTPHKAK